MAVAILFSIAVLVLFGPAGFLARFVLLSLLDLAFQDKAAELQANVDIGALTTGLAIKEDAPILDNDVGLGVLALLAENKLADKSI